MYYVSAQGIDERMINVHYYYYYYYRHVRASFSPESLQAGSVKGLSTTGSVKALSIVIIIITDRSYVALFSAVGQSQCAFMSHMILNE